MSAFYNNSTVVGGNPAVWSSDNMHFCDFRKRIFKRYGFCWIYILSWCLLCRRTPSFLFLFLFCQECSERFGLTSACMPSPALHTRSLCVCSATENEGRPQRTITTKHIPFCPTAPPAQTETQALCVYQASPGESADLGPLARVLFGTKRSRWDTVETLSFKSALRIWYVW